MANLMNENWKATYNGNYEVSDLGRVRRTDTGRILKPLTGSRYLRVQLYQNGHGEHRVIHQLVLEAFVGMRPEGKEANHKNLNRLDNRLENLEWISHSENLDHARQNGHWPIGERHGSAKLTEDNVREIRRLHRLKDRRYGSPYTAGRLAKRFGVTQKAVWHIVNGTTWTHVI